jgi:hypothetical protein
MMPQISPCAAAPGSALIRFIIFIVKVLLIDKTAGEEASFPAVCGLNM